MLNIAELDKNVAVATSLQEEDLVFVNALDGPFDICGVADAKAQGYLRMPAASAAAVSEGVAELMPCTSGVRVRFSTNSPHIAIKCEYSGLGRLSLMALMGSAGFDLYEDSPDGGKSTYVRSFVPPDEMETGYESLLRVGEGPVRYYTIHFPPYSSVSSFYVGLSRAAQVGAGAPYRHKLPVVFYGSSITMGGCVSRPGNIYPAFISRMLRTDFVNLGLAGNAKGEPAMAEYLASCEMSVLVLDYDHNAPTVEHLRDTYEPFFGLIRAKRPDLPVIMVSRPDFEVDPADSEKRREIIRAAYEGAAAKGDGRLYYIDGETLFGDDCRTDCTVDGVHPNDLGAYRIALNMAPVIKKAMGQ